MSESTHVIHVDADNAGARLDRFLSARLPDFSRSRLQALIAQGCVTCKDKPALDASAKVKAGQEFTLTIPETAPTHMLAQDIALDVIYEDEHLLVINKPAGLTVHPAPGHPDMTLVNALLAHCGSSLSGIGGVARPGIVHRIDKDTSGLLVVAKHDAAHIHLSAQLAERTLKRTYTAIVWGAPKLPAGTITGNIGRSSSNRQKMAVVKTGGKAAMTHYKIVALYPLPPHGGGLGRRGSLNELNVRDRGELPLSHPFGAPSPTRVEGSFALLECNLETGRTHQIRVHMAFIGNPLVGDPAYGGSTASRLNAGIYKSLRDKTLATLLDFKRQALHAKKLVLIHPATGKSMKFECELPEDMKELIEVLGT